MADARARSIAPLARKERRRELLLSFGIPLALAIFMFSAAQALYPPLPVIQDAYCYNLSAQRLLTDGFFAHGVEPPGSDIEPNAATTPGYHLLLAGVYILTGSVGSDSGASILAVMPAVRALQFLLALGIVACIAAAGRMLGGWRVALAGGVLAALYLPFGWSASVALSEAVGAFLVSLQLLIAVRIAGKPTEDDPRMFAALGLVSAALALTRPVMALWIFVPIVFVAFTRRTERKHVAKLLAVTIGAFLLLMGPWWIRNVVTLDRFVPLSEGAGLPLLEAAGGQPLSAEEQAVFDEEKSAGRDGFLAAAKYRLREQLEADPLALLRERFGRAGVVMTQVWSAPGDVYWEKFYNPNWESLGVGAAPPDPSEKFAVTLTFAGYYHMVLLALALPAVFLVRRSPRLLLALSLPIYSAVVHLPTLFINRYFFPVMPGVILAAGVVIVVGWHRVRLSATKTVGDV